MFLTFKYFWVLWCDCWQTEEDLYPDLDLCLEKLRPDLKLRSDLEDLDFENLRWDLELWSDLEGLDFKDLH